MDRQEEAAGIRVTLTPEAACAILSLAGSAGAPELPERRHGAEELVTLLLHHPTTEMVMEAERIKAGDLRAALLRFAQGEPSGLPGLNLDRIREHRKHLGERLRDVTADLSWLERARQLAFHHLPWRHELDGEIRVFLMLLGAGLFDGEARVSGSVVEVALDLFFLSDPGDLRVVAAHEMDHAGVYLYWRGDHPQPEARWMKLPETMRQMGELLYLEGLARFATLGRRYRPDIEYCFAVFQEALDQARTGASPARDDLWQGEDGEGHVGGTVGAFIFETLRRSIPDEDWDRTLRGGPEAVLNRYDPLARAQALPRLRFEAQG
ncbi:MAG: hypothetical protein QME70_11905 [Bacillota bacterium]|nr:hypothetical protein [Bacillota bacterium]